MPQSLSARNFMTKNLVTVHPDTQAYDAIVLLLKHEISGMPVVDEAGKLVGILSERDCMKTFMHAQYHTLPTALVKDLMTKEVETVRPDMDILEVAELFVNRRYRRFPVLEGDELVGQISRRDVLRAIRDMQ